ncbi:Stimulated by retinoic acid gene 6 protein-like [Geodia barretti]|nr:Stimulated by retinoic acid gene 6 protein-like [Geodia barretti]
MSDQFLNLALIGGGSVFSTIITNPYALAICDVAISNVLSVLLVCLLYGPLFACVNTPRPRLGHITGLLYLLLIATFETYSGVVYTQCDGVTYNGGQMTLIILTSLPSYMFYVILIAWFIYEIVNDVAIAKRGRGILSHTKRFPVSSETCCSTGGDDSPNFKTDSVVDPRGTVCTQTYVQVVFLENDTGGKFLSITNRNGFNCFLVLCLLVQWDCGFVAAIFRVLLGLLFGTLLLFRLDQNIMMDHFKFADLGHKTYLGFLYLEHTYNNPVANAFVALLTDGGDQEDKYSLKRPPGRNRRIRNRWLVAYTLMNNPGLIPLRASQMEAQRDGVGQEAEPEKRALNDYEPIVLVH